MALAPKAIKGVVYFLRPWQSISQYDKARKAVARPPAYKTKEEVHKALFIGKKRFQINPDRIDIKAIEKSHATLLASGISFRFRMPPAAIPKRQVETAGKVLRSPSGSHVLLCRHTWLV